MEKQILQAMLNDRSTYDLFERIGHLDDFSPIGRTVARAVKEYYDVDPNIRSCDLGIIQERLFARITNNKHEAPIREYLRSLPEAVSGPNVERSIREIHRKSVDGKLSLALANGAPEEEKQRLWKEREAAGESNVSVSQERLLDVLDTTDLTEEKANVEYIKLWPRELNDRLDGGALRGHHVLVFARPETGKTLFAINLVCGFLWQKLNVLYVGNEEPGADIRDRIRGRILKVSKRTIREEPARAADALRNADIGGIALAEGTNFAGVRDTLRRCNDPCDVVILDQIRNMRLDSESRTAELEAAGIAARAIAKEFNVLVISITQAGNSADGKVFLEMSDVDSSKTGLPASADLMIGLGADESMKVNGLLGVSLPKNKLSGIHDKFTCSINYQTGVIGA